MHPCRADVNTKVAVCVSTYLRPIGLSRLLLSLSALEFRKHRAVTVELVVVDNDATGSAAATVAAVSAAIHSPIRYAIEPERGISFARNRTAALARDADYVAFVDDDTVVAPDWLDELLDAAVEHGADIVAGPVPPIFESPPPPWIIAGRFFERVAYPTGTVLTWNSLPNVLIRRAVLDRLPGPFDPRFALTGGEDTLMIMQLVRTGARLVWCNEAVTPEYIPNNRATMRWLLRRAYNIGNSQALCDKVLDPGPRRQAILVGMAVARIAQGLLGVIPALFLGRAQLTHQLGAITKGAGKLLGTLGRPVEEYRHVTAH
jgi:glycosyltransferase involved in cell wall biosynthesis